MIVTRRMIKLARKNGTYERLYSDVVHRFVRRRHSQGDVEAILRQRDSKPEEFERFNAYAEQCKAEAKAYLDRIEG